MVTIIIVIQVNKNTSYVIAFDVLVALFQEINTIKTNG